MKSVFGLFTVGYAAIALLFGRAALNRTVERLEPEGIRAARREDHKVQSD